ncbi:MAG: glycerophosphoryl diester phosphodiesterase membrane domain-containing protein [bacterium]|nr:glycerophosphoryl diester phosphodiesterase membrane domain-containing protein [bacterium]
MHNPDIASQTESLITMRPMDLGEILDGTIRVYRRRPWLFVSIIAAIAGIPMTITQISALMMSEYFNQMVLSNMSNIQNFSPFNLQFMLDKAVTITLILICGDANFFLQTIATGAAVHGVSETILGRDVLFSDCMIVIWPLSGEILVAKFLAGAITVIPIVIIIALVISSTYMNPYAGAGAFLGIITILVLVMYFLIFYFLIRFLFIPQIVVIEKIDAFKTIKRSLKITNGFGWRIFWLIFVIGFIIGVIGLLLQQGITLSVKGIEAIPGVNHAIGLAIEGVLMTIVNFMTYPVMFIATTLIYYDILIRKEGFDLVHLARSMGIEPKEPESPLESVPLG